MSLDAQCARCQGYFRNFQQIVCRDGETYCVQCDAALKAGASPVMYDRQLPANSIFDSAGATVAGYSAAG